MATSLNPNGSLQGVIPFPQHAQPNQQIPTGQQVAPQSQQIAFGLDQLPPAPQQQQGAWGQQPNFGPQQFVPGQQQQQFPQQTQGLQPQQFQQPWGQPLQQGQQAFQSQPQQMQPGWQQPQQFSQQQQQPGGLNMQTRLQGPGIPPELQGRTMGEALGIYSALATEWMGRQRQQQTPAGQSLQAMQPQQQQPGQQGQPGPQQIPWQSRMPQQQIGQQPNLWTNPEETIGQIVEQKIGPLLAPVVQHTQQQAITQAYAIANQSVVDFRALEPEIMQMLAGADPSSLNNPQTWIGAADIIRGRQMREGRYQPPQQNGQQQMQIPGRQQNPAMVGAQPTQQTQVPVYGFFTEQPSAPGVSQFGAGQPSAQDQAYAQRFNMQISDYMAWKYGVQQNGQVQPQNGQSWNGGVR